MILRIGTEVLTADSLQRFQKDAIWRQMQEYKREKTSLETRLKELSKSAAYHDEHLRVIDAWLQQVCTPPCVTAALRPYSDVCLVD